MHKSIFVPRRSPKSLRESRAAFPAVQVPRLAQTSLALVLSGQGRQASVAAPRAIQWGALRPTGNQRTKVRRVCRNLKVWECNRLMHSHQHKSLRAVIHSFKSTVSHGFRSPSALRYPSSSQAFGYSTIRPTTVRSIPATMSPMYVEDKLNIDRIAVIGAGPCGLAAAK